MAKVRVENLDVRIRKTMTFIDTAIAHLKSYFFAHPDPSIESAMTWLLDAKNELQSLLDDTLRSVVILIDANAATAIAKRARVRTKDAIEVLVGKCVDEYLTTESG